MTSVSGAVELSSRLSECVQFAQETCIDGSLVHASYGLHHVAIANDNLLSIVAPKSAADSEEDIADVEFDETIEAVCWGPDASCIIVGDSNGALHFLTPTGDTIFSHGLLSE